MLTAKEALLISKEGAKLNLLPLIESIIKNAAKLGQESVFINSDNITNSIRELLVEKGYFVGANNSNKTEIIWRNSI